MIRRMMIGRMLNIHLATAVVIFFCQAIAVICCAADIPRRLSNVDRWICFYGEKFDGIIPRADLYILADGIHPDLSLLKNHKAFVVGYISLGEIREDVQAWKGFPKWLLVERNSNWPGSWRVDVREKAWNEFILERIIPNLIVQGYDGVFLDTVDTAHYLETMKGYRGARKSMVKLVRDIHKKFPSLIIIQNNGLDLIGETAKYIDALLVEGVFSDYDFVTKKYSLSNEEDERELSNRLSNIRDSNMLPIFTLDYASPDDKTTASDLKSKSVEMGFIPYIAEISLMKIPFPPQ